MSITDQPQAPKKPGIIRRTYDLMMRNATGPRAWWTLGGLTFAEASVFPIPTDIMLIPMALADRKRAWLLGAWCTVCSVLGGALGYAIGAFLFDSLGSWLVALYQMGDDLVQFQQWYKDYGAWIIILKGFTPIPYKLVTIASGFAHYNFWTFMLLSAITRGGRFMLLAGLIYWKGEVARDFIEKRLEVTLIGFLVFVGAGAVAVKYLF
jgi:membrane protein YqaA with SNARE-associated domain